MKRMGRLKIKIARKLLGRVTTHEIDNIEQAHVIINALRTLKSIAEDDNGNN